MAGSGGGEEQRPQDDRPGEARRRGIGGDLLIPLLALAFAAYFFISISGLQWEARANGTVIGVILVVLSVAQIVRSVLLVRWDVASFSVGPLLEPREVLGRRLALVAMLAAFVWFIEWTGTTLGLILMMLASMWTMGVRDWRSLALIATGVPLLVCGLFIFLLGTKLPAGPIEHMLAALLGAQT
jgi:hypothetical protein